MTRSGGSIWSGRHDFLVVNDFARHTGWLHAILTGYANYGIAMFALLLIAGWWVARRSGDPRRVGLALWAGVGTLAAVAINQPIVNSVHESRPYAVLPRVLLLVHRSADPSFPSDHATAAGAIAAGLFFVSRRLGITAAFAALLMAFSRVYVGAHWPRDVAAGLLLGVLVVGVVAALAGHTFGRAVAVLARTRLRPLLLAASPTGEHPAPVAPQPAELAEPVVLEPGGDRAG